MTTTTVPIAGDFTAADREQLLTIYKLAHSHLSSAVRTLELVAGDAERISADVLLCNLRDVLQAVDGVTKTVGREGRKVERRAERQAAKRSATSEPEPAEEPDETAVCRICGNEITLDGDRWTHIDPLHDAHGARPNPAPWEIRGEGDVLEDEFPEEDLADEVAEELDEAEQWPIDPPSLSDGSDVKQNGDHFEFGPDSAGPQVIEPEAHEVMTEPITPHGWCSRVSRWWRRVAEPVVDMIQVILRVVAGWWQCREVKVISVPSATVQMFNGRAGISFATTSRFKSTLWVDMSRETLEELRAKLDTINAMLEGDG